MMTGHGYAAALRLMALPVAALLATPAAAQQQQQNAPEPTLVLSGNVRGVRSDATTSRALAIEVLDLKVRIRGRVAETTMTATFRNDSNDILEGDFRFDMPAGSVVTGYALDIGGNMIDGVIAGRDQAREAYQRRVVQRIDPGLAEVTWADRFSTRIFPIPAHGSRTIRLVMTSPIDPLHGYVLPMRPSGAVGRFTMRIESDDGRPTEVVLPGRFNAQWQGGVLAVDDWSGMLAGELRLSPSPATGMTVSRHANGQAFFDIDDAAPTTIAGAAQNSPIHIFWDRSISRADDDLAAEKALLEAYLEAREPDAVMLTLFDSSGAETVRITDGAQMGTILDNPHYGGGSSFAVLGDVPVAAGATCLLFSDGRVTLDSRAAFALPCRTHAIASGREVDRGWLTHVAARSGGSFIELASMNQAAALSALERGGSDIGRIVDDAGEAIDTVRMAAADGRFRLVGPMPDSGGVNLMRGQERWRSYARPTLSSGLSHSQASAANASIPLFSGTGALWASRHIAARANEMRTADLVNLSRRYSVASPMASFIVLEQPADYVEANIPPPTSYPKPLTDQYLAMRAQADRAIGASQAARLGVVSALWRERVAWWETKFDERGQQGNDGQDNEGQGRDPRRNRETVPVTVSPPPPMPAPISA
ncbi:MAG: VIT domain-containing protein, partial [Sphingopyxis sp.]